MTTQTLSNVLMCVALILTLFSEKLFKQHEKIGKIICTIIVLVAILLMWLSKQQNNKENENNGNPWFGYSRFYYSSLSNRHFFNNKKYQEINIFPKNRSFSERYISIAKQPQTLGTQGFFRGLSP